MLIISSGRICSAIRSRRSRLDVVGLTAFNPCDGHRDERRQYQQKVMRPKELFQVNVSQSDLFHYSDDVPQPAPTSLSSALAAALPTLLEAKGLSPVMSFLS